MQGYTILENLQSIDLIDDTFDDHDRLIAINICQNNLQYVDDNYEKIRESQKFKIFLIAISVSKSIVLINFLMKNYQPADWIISMCKHNQNLNVIKHYLNKKKVSDIEFISTSYLIAACSSNPNLEIIKYMIQELKQNINFFDKYKRNCLMCACLSNPNLEIIKYLINEMNMDPLKTDCYGLNCLRLACYGNNTLEIIKYLVEECEIDPEIEDINGENCLLLSCYQNANLGTIKYLVEECGIDVHHIDRNKENCLIRLCERCPDFEIIKYLIDVCLMDLSKRDIDGNNLIGILLNNEDIDFEIIKYLVEVKKMNLWSINKQSETYMHILCKNANPNLNIIKYFVSFDKSLFHSGVKFTNYLYHADEHIIKYFIDIGAINLDNMPLSDQRIVFEHFKDKSIELKNHFTSKKKSDLYKYDSTFIRRYVNPLILNDTQRRFFGMDNPFDLPYDKLCRLVDELNIVVSFDMPKKQNSKKNNVMDTSLTNINDSLAKNKDYGPVFIHNGKKYSGRRNAVYEQMKLFTNSSDCISFNDEFVLEGSLPDHIVNFYINSCYSKKYDLSKISPCYFYQFIKFIDQYPTNVLCIENMTNQLINYLDTNGPLIPRSDFDSMKQIFTKYQNKELYICMHNIKVKMNQLNSRY